MRVNVLLVIAVVAVMGAASAQVLFAEDRLEWPDDDARYEQRDLPAYMFGPEEKDRSTIAVRFYENAPNVPYVDICGYYMRLQDSGMTVRHLGDGLFELTNGSVGGGKARVDTVRGTITSDDLTAFTLIKDPDAGDSGLDSRLVRTVSEGPLNNPDRVAIDLGSYGIVTHTDRGSKTLWVPFQTAADLFLNPNNLYASYVGGAVYFFNSSTLDRYGLYLKDTQYMGYIDQLMGEDRTRPADLVEYTYGELCMLFENLFGNPGKGEMSALLAEKGLDAALESHSDASRMIRSYLRSSDYGEYCAGLWKLYTLIFDGGHTQTHLGPVSFVRYLYMHTFDLELPDRIEDLAKGIPSPEVSDNSELRKALDTYRTQVWDIQYLSGGTMYVEKGDTAVFSFDDFDYADDEWAVYFKEGGDLPGDCIGQLYVALEKAASNPEIRNFVIDLTTNTGGFVTDVAFMRSLMTAQDVRVQQYDTRTGVVNEILLASDINLDGKYDDGDHVMPYDFNYGILTTTASFSCGNYLPVSAQRDGIMILGETSGGGSCTVSFATAAEGLQMTVSSYNKLVVGYGDEGFDVNAVERGAAPDAVLVTVDEQGDVDYSGIYDLDVISQRMNGFYSI